MTLRSRRHPYGSTVAASGLLLVAVLSAGSLLVGAGYVALTLPFGLPFGNLLAATVYCGLAGATVLLAPRGSQARTTARVALLASVAWLPLSIALAGNVSLNFAGQRGIAWLWLSAGLLVVDLIALVFAAGAAFLARRKQGRAP